MNLYEAKAFPVRIGSELRFMTIEEAFRCVEPGQIQHPAGFLTGPLRLLAQALVQHLASVAGELPTDMWRQAVQDARMDAAANLLFAPDNLAKAKNGFDLFAPSAFMQMPGALFEGVKAEAIEGIFQPFRARRGGDAKALRAQQVGIEKICPCCAAAGVFTTQTLSCSMAQYWGAAATRGACVYGIALPTVGQSIAVNLLNSASPFVHGQKRNLPWIADSQDAEGFDRDLRMPFEKHIFPGEQMEHAANIMLPLVRAMRLQEPRANDVGTCDACGRHDQPMVRAFSLLSEKGVLAKVSQATALKYKQVNGEELAASGILTETVRPGAKHPSLAYVTSTKKTDDPSATPLIYPQMAMGGVDDLKQARPAWVQMSQMLGDGVIPPALIQQFRSANRPGSDTASLTMFGVRFEGATNPNPKYVLDAIYGLGHLVLTEERAEAFSNVMGVVVQRVDASIEALIAAAQILDHDVEKDSTGGLNRKVPGSTQRRKTARATVLVNPVIWTGAEKLWNDALGHLYVLAELLENGSFEECDTRTSQVLQDISKQAYRVWMSFLDSKAAQHASLQQLFLETQAQIVFNKLSDPSAKKPKKAS